MDVIGAVVRTNPSRADILEVIKLIRVQPCINTALVIFGIDCSDKAGDILQCVRRVRTI